VGIVAQQKGIVEQGVILYSAAVMVPVLKLVQPQDQLILPVRDVVAPTMVVIHVAHLNAALNSELNVGKLWITANQKQWLLRHIQRILWERLPGQFW
jgi:hypothetical protein